MKFHVSPHSYKPVESVVAYRQACATRLPVNSATHLVQERNLVSPLHDTGTECGQISYRYERFVPVQEPE